MFNQHVFTIYAKCFLCSASFAFGWRPLVPGTCKGFLNTILLHLMDLRTYQFVILLSDSTTGTTLYDHGLQYNNETRSWRNPIHFPLSYENQVRVLDTTIVKSTAVSTGAVSYRRNPVTVAMGLQRRKRTLLRINPFTTLPELNLHRRQMLQQPNLHQQ